MQVDVVFVCRNHDVIIVANASDRELAIGGIA